MKGPRSTRSQIPSIAEVLKILTPYLRGDPAPYFSMAQGEWIPCRLFWNPETGEFERVEGPKGFRELLQ